MSIARVLKDVTFYFKDMIIYVVDQSAGVGHKTRFRISLYATFILVRGALSMYPVI